MVVTGAEIDVVGLGEAMVLLEPQSGNLLDARSFDAFVAGAEFNACAAMASLGARATFVTRLGGDPFAARVRAAAASLLVAVDDVTDDTRPTGLFFKDHVVDGPRQVRYYRTGSAASELGPMDARRALAHAPRAVLLSGLTSALGDDSAELFRELGRQLEGQSTWLVLDVNLRPSLGRLDASVQALGDLLPSVRILVTGLDDGKLLFGTDDPQKIESAALAAGCSEVVITGGPEGCWWQDDDGMQHLPTLARQIVDPVGAGDAFTGGYTWARLRGLPPESAAQIGSRLAALVLAHHGDTSGLRYAGEVRDELELLIANPGAS